MPINKHFILCISTIIFFQSTEHLIFIEFFSFFDYLSLSKIRLSFMYIVNNIYFLYKTIDLTKVPKSKKFIIPLKLGLFFVYIINNIRNSLI